jgi:hypothetical protein
LVQPDFGGGNLLPPWPHNLALHITGEDEYLKLGKGKAPILLDTQINENI